MISARRTSRSTSRKPKPIVSTNGLNGIQKSLPRLDCNFRQVCFILDRYTEYAVYRYVVSVILRRLFLVKCNLSMLRLTPLLALTSLPIILTRLLCYHRRVRPPSSILSPSSEAVVLSAFPIAWFFGFLYYTDIPSLVSVVATVVAAGQGRHGLAGLVRSAFLYTCLLTGLMNVRCFLNLLAGHRQLHIPADKHSLGIVCLRPQSGYDLAVSPGNG